MDAFTYQVDIITRSLQPQLSVLWILIWIRQVISENRATNVKVYIYICTLSENKLKKMFALQAMDTDRKANPQWVFLLAWFATCGNIFFLTVNVSILCLSSNVKITKTTAQLYWKECKQASLLLFSIVSIICHVALHCLFQIVRSASIGIRRMTFVYFTNKAKMYSRGGFRGAPPPPPPPPP